MFLALLVVLPVLFVAGLASRHNAAKEKVVAEVWSNGQLVSLAGQRLHMRILKSAGATPSTRVELIPESPILAPDILVYWSKSDAATDLPSGAVLLGAFEPPKQYTIPEQEIKENGEGFLIFYSLGWKKTLGSVAIGSPGGPR